MRGDETKCMKRENERKEKEDTHTFLRPQREQVREEKEDNLKEAKQSFKELTDHTKGSRKGKYTCLDVCVCEGNNT